MIPPPIIDITVNRHSCGIQYLALLQKFLRIKDHKFWAQVNCINQTAH